MVGLGLDNTLYYKNFYTPAWNWQIVKNVNFTDVAISNTRIIGIDQDGSL